MGLKVKPRKTRFQKDRGGEYRKVTSPKPFSTWRSKGVPPKPPKKKKRPGAKGK